MRFRSAIFSVLFCSALPLFAQDCPLPEGFSAVEPFTPHIADTEMPQGYVLFNLWALWCAPCREELPLLNQLAKESSALQVFALNLNDGVEAATQLFADLSIDALPPISSADDNLLSQLKAIGLPYTAVLHDGQVIAVKHGILKETQSIKRFVTCQLGEK